MKSKFNLKNCQSVDGSDIIKDVYGDDMTAKLETVVQQLVFAKKALPGLNLPVLDYVIPLSEEEILAGENILDGYVKTSNDEEVTTILVQLASLLHLPNSYFHTQDGVLTQFDPDSSSKLIESIDVLETDFTFLHNSLKMGPDLSAVNNEEVVIKFEEVLLPDITILMTRPVCVTSQASANTLCLFGNMGPTPQHTERELSGSEKTIKMVMSYFSQPLFNFRHNVQLSRVQEMLITCSLNDGKHGLATHGVSVIPYIIKYGVPLVPLDSDQHTQIPVNTTETLDESFGTTKVGGTRDKVSPYNSVKPCFKVSVMGANRMCGNPSAEPLGKTDADESSIATQNIENLFSVLLGRKWQAAISSPEQYMTDIFKSGTENFKKFARLREIVLCQLLIELVNNEYDGFQNVMNWQKLHQRLIVSHGSYAKGLARPVIIRNLIYQCFLLVQATSNFRLAFSGGLGRHFGVMHSLLGVLPTETLLPLKYIQGAVSPLQQPFELTVLGRSNPKVDIVDIGTSSGVFDEKHHKLANNLSVTAQKKDEALVMSDISIFFIRWCLICSDRTFNLLQKIKPLEFTNDISGKFVYKKTNFSEFDATVPMLAIQFICQEFKPEPHADFATIKFIVQKAIFDKKKTKEKMVPPSIDHLDEVQKWVFNGLMIQFGKGYVTRLQKLWNEHLHTIVFIMSHGCYWLPGKTPNECLQQFIQNGGACAGTYKQFRTMNESDLYYPNPMANVCETDYPSCDTPKFWSDASSLHFFIPGDQVKVSLLPKYVIHVTLLFIKYLNNIFCY